VVCDRQDHGIKLCESLRKQYGFDAISLMPTNLYGPGDNYHPENSHVLPALIRRFHEAKEAGSKSVTCWGTGSPMREFLHVDDLGEATVYTLENWNPDQDTCISQTNFLNVGTGTDISIKNLAELIANAFNYEGYIEWDSTKPDGTPKKQLDISRISSIGWEPKIKLKNGIIKEVNAYEKMIASGAQLRGLKN